MNDMMQQPQQEEPQVTLTVKASYGIKNKNQMP